MKIRKNHVDPWSDSADHHRMVQLSDELARLAEEEMRAGRYSSIDEVLRVALAQLRQGREDASAFGDFEPGELAALAEVGMKDFREGRVLSHEESIAHMQRLSDEKRRSLRMAEES